MLRVKEGCFQSASKTMYDPQTFDLMQSWGNKVIVK